MPSLPPNRPVGEDLLALIARARDDEVAYVELQQCYNEALVGVLFREWSLKESAGRAVAVLIWLEAKTRILRRPEEGGYSLQPVPPRQRPKLFHRYVLDDCTDWGRLRAAAGDDRATEEVWSDPPEADDGELDPAEAAQRLDAFNALFALIFDPACGYPHEQLAFVYATYVYGKGEQGLTGGVQTTQEKCGRRSLRALTVELEIVVTESMGRPAKEFDRPLETSFAPLYRRLALAVRAMLTEARDTRALQGFARLLERLVGDTCMCDYADPSPIAEWCRKVREKISRRIQGDGAENSSPRDPWDRLPR